LKRSARNPAMSTKPPLKNDAGYSRSTRRAISAATADASPILDAYTYTTVGVPLIRLSAEGDPKIAYYLELNLIVMYSMKLY